MAPYTELSLFTGAGGGLLGTTHLLGWRTVCYVEWDKYAVEVLKARIRDGYLHDAPIWDDAFTFDGRPWRGLVDIVTAGFPCQPFSVAGKGLAENDPRNGWPAVIRILREVRPRFALLENVSKILTYKYAGTIFGELAESGYQFRYDCIPASSIGANHERDRWWLVANAEGGAWDIPTKYEREEVLHPYGNGTAQQISDTQIKGLEGSISAGSTRTDGCTAERPERDWWAVEPELGRVADGVANRLDRLRAIGNGQVPAVVREAWNRLSGEFINA